MTERVVDYFELPCNQLFTPGRYPAVVRARSVLCFLAVRGLGITATELARQKGLTQPAISIAVKRGEEVVKQNKISLDDFIA